MRASVLWCRLVTCNPNLKLVQEMGAERARIATSSVIKQKLEQEENLIVLRAEKNIERERTVFVCDAKIQGD